MPSLSDIAEAQHRYEEMMMHIATCDMCGSLQPISCETGRSMGIRYLEWAARKGDRNAQTMLDKMREAKFDLNKLIPPGTQIRRF